MKIKLNTKSMMVMISLIGFLYSCSTSNSVVSNRLISKRKYTDGFHYNGKVNVKSSDNVAEESEKTEKSVRLISEKQIANETVGKSLTANNTQDQVVESNLSEKANDVELVSIESKKDHKISTSSVVERKSSGSNLKKVIQHKVVKVAAKKAADKKQLKEQSKGGDQAILYIILCILIPFVAVGLATDWDVLKVVICLLLSFLFWIPGIIYAFIVCNQEGVI